MGDVSADRVKTFRCDLAPSSLSALLVIALSSCGELLGIPNDPRLVAAATADAMAPTGVLATDAGIEMSAGGQPGARPVASTEGDPNVISMIAPPVAGPTGTQTPGLVDSGVPSLTADEPDAAEPACAPGEALGRVPLDIVVVVGNSPSMAAADEVVELNLSPSLAAILDANGVDYRIILLSRHRSEARAASAVASASICIPTPLSGLASCPGAVPALSERFFHYSVTIDATDSFERILETYAAPDVLGLTALGWSEWLRLDALQVFIEITDADAGMLPTEFLERLAVLGPEHFGSDPLRPTFVFHSLLGVREKLLVTAGYQPGEPIEPLTCASQLVTPANAGEAYQQVSRVTGGIRFPLCPLSAVDDRLRVLATDLSSRSIRACPADAGEPLAQ